MEQYLSNGYNEQFSHWFSNVSKVIDPDCNITDRSALNVTIVVTQDCNFACSYCYQHGKTPDRMTKETAIMAVDFLLGDKINEYIDKDNSPAIILDFIGGEPLLEIDLIDYFMDYFLYKAFKEKHRWALNYSIGMSSNGSLYSTHRVQRFVKKYRGRCNIAITIDGMKELHDSCRLYPNGKGTFDDVYRNVKLHLLQGGHPSTKITIAPENLKYIDESVVFLFNLGYKWINGNVVFENVWNIDYAKELYLKLKSLSDIIIDNELYKGHRLTMFDETIGRPMNPEDDTNWCGGNASMLAIGTDGICYPCLRYMKYCLSTPEREPLIIGNITEGINNDIPVLKELRSITRSSQSTEDCFNCPIAKGCSWCSAFNYDIYGTANKRATFLCVMHKARVLANIYYWNKLYRKLGLEDRFPYYVPDEWARGIIDESEIAHLKELAGGEETNG
jgi:uncharacterized protein